MKVVYLFIKEKWKLLILCTILLIVNVFLHIIILLGGSIQLFTLGVFIVSCIFIFSILKKFYKTFFLGVLILIFFEFIIFIIPFPKCSFTFKIPKYNCECMGIVKDAFGTSQCIGKIKNCYIYSYNNSNGNLALDTYYKDRFHKDFEVSCESFPDKFYKHK